MFSYKKNLEYGPLWCDDGVYRITNGIQFLKADELKIFF